MRAIPTATETPLSRLVGIVQKGATIENTPSTATLMAAIDRAREFEYAATPKAAAPANAGSAVCQRRSPDRSEWTPTQIITITAARYGIVMIWVGVHSDRSG